jgi:putative membrane protein
MDDTFPFDTESPGLFRGAIAGLVATAPMTAVMLVLHRLLPGYQRYPLEPYRITTRMARRLRLSHVIDDQESRLAATTVAHFGYGAAAGALFPPLLGWLPLHPVLAGVLYGLAVWAGSYLGLIPALGIISPATKHPRRRNLLMVVAHLLWGATLGMLVGRRAQA